MDTSSDSSDTIILPLNDDFDESSDTDVESALLKKYGNASGAPSCIAPRVESKDAASFEKSFNDLDFSDEDLIDVPLAKRVRKNKDEIYKNGQFNDINHKTGDSVTYVPRQVDLNDGDILKKLQCKYSTSSSTLKSDLITLSDSSDTESVHSFSAISVTGQQTADSEVNDKALLSFEDGGEALEQLSPKTTGKYKRHREMQRKKSVKERKKEEAERKKAMQNLEKEKKKEAAERQKAFKIALRNVERSTKPEECIKYMTVEIDEEILDKEYGPILKAALNNNDISFKAASQVIPKLVSWRRKIQTIENMQVKDAEVNEKHFLLIMDSNEFSNLVRNNSLTLRLKEITELIQPKQLSLAVLGLDRVKGEEDFAVTEAQLFTKCYFRFIKKNEDLAAFVMELTKSVAQIPYKLKKEEKQMLQSEYFNDSNKDCVRVDKNGNGLGRLWHQMLTMFPLARLETAEAITAVYPTPSSLFKAYENCTTEKEKLIQDLPIRRAIGPCVSVRRIGAELSKKCCNFFCSTENVLL